MNVHPLQPNVLLASAGTSAASVAQATTSGTISINPVWYGAVAVALGLAGVYLARIVTIDAENKRLGRLQTMRETLPLTLIGVLIVCPVIWHFEIEIPWASMIGLGVGYTVRVVLRILGDGAVEAARALARKAAGTLEEEQRHQAPDPLAAPPRRALPRGTNGAWPLPASDRPADLAKPVEQLRAVPPTPSPPADDD